MTLWEWTACILGWNRANSSEEEEPPQMTAGDYFDMIERHKDWIKSNAGR